MVRYPNWHPLLNQYLYKNKNIVFEWGVNDCYTFCAGAVHVMTGVNVQKQIKGTYKTQIGALRHVKNCGYSNFTEIIDRYFKRHQNVQKAHVGDLVLVNNEKEFGPALTINLGRVSVGLGKDQLVYIQREHWLTGWVV